MNEQDRLARAIGELARHANTLVVAHVDVAGKGRPAARPAGDADVAAHHPGQPPGDGQPQANPTKTARMRAIRLGELLKDCPLQFLGDPDPGIAYGEPEPGFARGQWLGTQVDDNLAPIRKLDGVADQVEQDLPQPMFICPHGRRDGAIDLADEFQSLPIHFQAHEIHDLGKQSFQVAGAQFERKRGRLDLGKV